MTLIGKLLAFLNLIVGIALISWSVSLYTMRPGWFEPIPDGVSPGNSPVSFAQLKAETEALGRTASAASTNWGTQLKILEELEARRADRLSKYAVRLKWTESGNPADKDGAGFYKRTFDPDTGLLVLDNAKPGETIKGSDDKPLKGADVLMTNFSADVAKVAELAYQNKDLRDEYTAISKVILRTEEKLVKMSVIREAVQAEMFYLASFEVNVYETRETVFRRKKQLDNRLAEFKK